MAKELITQEITHDEHAEKGAVAAGVPAKLAFPD